MTKPEQAAAKPFRGEARRRMPDNNRRPLSSEARTHPAKRTIIWLVFAVILVVGVFALVGMAADFGEIKDGLRNADYRWLPLCLIGELIRYTGYIFAYRDFAHVKDGPQLTMKLAGQVVVIGIGATALGSAPGGLALDYWALNKAGASRRDAFRRVLGLNTAKWLSLAILAAVGAVLTILGVGSAPDAMAIVWFCVVALAVGLAIFLTFGQRGARFSTPPQLPAQKVNDAKSLGRWSRVALKEAFSDAIGGVLYVRWLYAEPRRHRAGVAGFPLYWIGGMLTFWAALRAFGIELNLATLVLAYATGYVATGLPLPNGGSGGVEAGMTFALAACGVPLATALLAVVCFRLFDFWLPLIPALIIVPRLNAVEGQLTALASAHRLRTSL